VIIGGKSGKSPLIFTAEYRAEVKAMKITVNRKLAFQAVTVAIVIASVFGAVFNSARANHHVN